MRRADHHRWLHRPRLHEHFTGARQHDRHDPRFRYPILGPVASSLVVHSHDRGRSGRERMNASLDSRIHRATDLAQTYPSAASLLSFYRELARFQKSVFEDAQSNAITDARALTRHFPALLDLMSRIGAQPIAEFGREHLQNAAAQEELLLGYWEHGPVNGLTGAEAGRFFARVLLQPYAEYLASRGDIALDKAEPTCPFCNARPVAAVLRGEGDGAKRWLLCSLCAT